MDKYQEAIDRILTKLGNPGLSLEKIERLTTCLQRISEAASRDRDWRGEDEGSIPSVLRGKLYLDGQDHPPLPVEVLEGSCSVGRVKIESVILGRLADWLRSYDRGAFSPRFIFLQGDATDSETSSSMYGVVTDVHYLGSRRGGDRVRCVLEERIRRKG